MVDGIKGFDKVHKNSIGFKSVLASEEEGFLDGMLGLLTTYMTELGGWVNLFKPL